MINTFGVSDIINPGINPVWHANRGMFRLGDQIVKPSKEVLIGDTISVRKNQIWHELLVMDIPKSRLGAKLVDIYRQNITPKMPLITQIFNPFPKFRKEKKEVEDPPKKIAEKWMIILKAHKYKKHQDMIYSNYKNLIQQQIF